MAQWDATHLKRGDDPLGRGLAQLLEKGAQSAVFLLITQAPSGGPVPHFAATAAVGSRERLQLWTGLKWDPAVLPELWNAFVRNGYVELAPPGTSTNVRSQRNLVRSAFGVESSEWLLLVRTGPAHACRGVLAVLSQRSLLSELPSALALLAAPAPGTGTGKGRQAG